MKHLVPALTLVLPALAQGRAQEVEPPAEVDTSKLELYLDKARNGSAVIRPQAARRLVPMGAPAVERLLEVCGDSPGEMAAIGSELTEVLGEFEDARLRAKLWQALGDADFPWRPAAARSLATAPEAGERERIEALLEDPIAPVRMAAVLAVAALAPADEAQLLVPRLSDSNDRVRRVAALRLDELGARWTMRWLLEDLVREDAFFELPTGRMARYESMRALAELDVDLAGYDPEQAPTSRTNAKALAIIGSALRTRAEDDELPSGAERVAEAARNAGLRPDWSASLPTVARAAKPVDDAVIGLEIKSCRRGEHYLRWTRGDELVVGIGNPARIALPEGTVADLLRAADPALDQLDGQLFFGVPGCDAEQLRVQSSVQDPTRMVIISKGQAAIDNLRPAALSAYLEQLVASIPAEIAGSDLGTENQGSGDQEIGAQSMGDPRTQHLRGRVAATLAAVGGRIRD